MTTDSTEVSKVSDFDLVAHTETLEMEVTVRVKVPLGLCIIYSIPEAPVASANHFLNGFTSAVCQQFDQLKQTCPETMRKIERFWACSRELHAMYKWCNDHQRFERTETYDLLRGVELIGEGRRISQEILGDIPTASSSPFSEELENIFRNAV